MPRKTLKDRRGSSALRPPGEEMFEEVAKRFLTHQKARLMVHAYDRESSTINNHLTSFFNFKIAAIRRTDVQRYVTKRSGEVSAHSVTKELNILKHLLRLAVEWEIIPINPAQGVKAPKVPAGRVRYLHPKELRALIEISPQWLRPIVALAVTTGMRRSEIINLRWLDVDLEHARIMLPQTKNGDGRIIYLNGSAQAVLSSLPLRSPRQPIVPVFPDINPGQVTVAFRRACEKLKIIDCRFYDLRHRGELDADERRRHRVSQLLGHKRTHRADSQIQSGPRLIRTYRAGEASLRPAREQTDGRTVRE
jgi:integrase